MQAEQIDGVTVNTLPVETNYGYPDANDLTNINAWTDFSTGDWTITSGAGAGSTAATATTPGSNTFAVSPTGAVVDFTITAVTGNSCHVLYTNATGATDAPDVTVVSGSC